MYHLALACVCRSRSRSNGIGLWQTALRHSARCEPLLGGHLGSFAVHPLHQSHIRHCLLWMVLVPDRLHLGIQHNVTLCQKSTWGHLWCTLCTDTKEQCFWTKSQLQQAIYVCHGSPTISWDEFLWPMGHIPFGFPISIPVSDPRVHRLLCSLTVVSIPQWEFKFDNCNKYSIKSGLL